MPKRGLSSWAPTFDRWATAPSQTEAAKCENAERGIRAAIAASPKLRQLDLQIFAQGSYRNRTNVRADSDVDICILCAQTFFYDLPTPTSDRALFSIAPATYHYSDFRNDVGAALVAAFGTTAVTRGNKAFDVKENTYRIAADVVACFEYRRYRSTSSYFSGVAFNPDRGSQVTNFPEQHYSNGVQKNDRTSRAFKAVVRILKTLRSEMKDENVQSTDAARSFLLECLVWNVPEAGFAQESYLERVRYALAYLCDETRLGHSAANWSEINGIKNLWNEGQAWTMADANRFLNDAWNYVGFT